MATTIVPAPAVITLGVTLTLGGKEYDISFQRTITAVTRADRNIVPVITAAEQGIIQLFSGATAIGKGDFADYDGFFIMNRDDTNFVRIRWTDTGGDTVDMRLDPGEFMVFWNSKLEVNTTEAAFGAFVDFDNVFLQADTASVDIEYLAIEV